MSRIFNHRPSPALVVALLALFVVLGSGAYAATQINGKNLKDRSVAGKKLKRNTVTGTEVREPALGKVPTASTAGHANTASTANSAKTAGLAGKLAAPEGWHEVGAAGEPAFQNSWMNTCCAGANDVVEKVGFYKDREGVVHLKGEAKGGTSTIFQLPVGYRPANHKLLFFAAACGCSATDSPTGDTVNLPTGTLRIFGSGFSAADEGSVLLGNGGTSVHLDGITFRAAS